MISTTSKAAGFLLFAVSPLAFAQSPPPQPSPGAAPPPMHLQGLTVTPKNGQNQDQEWSDRYACDAWSKTESGFDPAHPPAGVPASDLALKRDAYKRAMSACFDARGYTVTTAAPLPAAPPPVYIVAASGFRYHPLMVQIEGGYSLTHGNTAESLNGGWNTGLGLTWYPSSALPFGLRLDGSYSRFDLTTQSLYGASQALGTDVALGHQDVYGADLDAEFDFKMSQHVKGYLFGGAGRYRASTLMSNLATRPALSVLAIATPPTLDTPMRWRITPPAGSTPGTPGWDSSSRSRIRSASSSRPAISALLMLRLRLRWTRCRSSCRSGWGCGSHLPRPWNTRMLPAAPWRCK